MKYRTLVALAACLCVSLGARAVEKKAAIRITILDSETKSVTLDDSGVPKNCDGVNYDAYCLGSKTAEITNFLLVQEGEHPPVWVSCSINTKWSKCVPLPKGESFNARQEKRGLGIYFLDDNGKVRQQLYTYVADAKGKSEAVAKSQVRSGQVQPNAVLASPTPAAAPAVTTGETVQCSFTSTPAGAEIAVDGKYVGSTPSVVSLSVGTHAIEVLLPGFEQWKRELAVSRGSELTVNAVLQKVQ